MIERSKVNTEFLWSTRLDKIKNFHDPIHLGVVADAGACYLGEGQLVDGLGQSAEPSR